jgi:hypothetical protein
MGNAQTALDIGDNVEPARRYGEVRDLMFTAVNDCAEDHDIPQGALALLLVDLGVSAYMLAYVLRTEKPSALGLKLELDRFRHEIEDFLRSTKKSAAEFVSVTEQALNALASDETTGTPNAAA